MQRIVRLVSTLVLAVFLSACGNEAPPPATVTPVQTPLIDLSTQTATTAADNTVSPVQSTIPGDPTTSPVEGQRTIGDIADRIGLAWSGVATYRVTSLGESIMVASPVSGATPIVMPPAVNVVDEFQLPSRRSRVQSVGGVITLELLVIDGAIYARGTTVPGLSPTIDPEIWNRIDESLLGPSSPFGEMYSALLEPITAPYSGLSDDERERIARPAGTIMVNGNSCTVYETADTTVIGERVTVLIAIGADDLPCSIETHVAGSVNVSTFEYNIPLTIEPPESST